MATDDNDAEPLSDPDEPLSDLDEPDSDQEEPDPGPKNKLAQRLNLNLNRWQVAAIGAAGVVLAAIAVFFIARALLATPIEPPRDTTLVYDDAGLMSPIQRDFLATFHGFLLDDYDIDYRVVTVKGAADIDGYAIQRFEDLFANSRSGTGRGLLLVVDPVLDRVRLEVAFALEGDFPDAFIAYIENRQMVPFFRKKRIADGILASTELIIDRAQRAAATAGLDTEPSATESGGAGAAATARIGEGAETIPKPPPAPPAAAQQTPRPARTPTQALQAYFDTMSARNTDPDLPFYTPGTRQMLRGQTVTRAQMDFVVKTYRRCRAEPKLTSPDGQLAVLRYPVAQHACAPFFFQKIDGDWALDLTMMQQAIRFGRSNAWHFDPSVDHPYRFGFADWRFDKNGFPKEAR